MKQIFLLFLGLVFFSSCGFEFTDVVIKNSNGQKFTAHVIEERVRIPEVGDSISILRTSMTDGWLYNSHSWREEDEFSNLFDTREIERGIVTEILPKK